MKIQCPTCNKVYEIPESLCDSELCCPACKTAFIVPKQKSSAPEPEGKVPANIALNEKNTMHSASTRTTCGIRFKIVGILMIIAAVIVFIYAGSVSGSNTYSSTETVFQQIYVQLRDNKNELINIKIALYHILAVILFVGGIISIAMGEGLRRLKRLANK